MAEIYGYGSQEPEALRRFEEAVKAGLQVESLDHVGLYKHENLIAAHNPKDGKLIHVPSNVQEQDAANFTHLTTLASGLKNESILEHVANHLEKYKTLGGIDKNATLESVDKNATLEAAEKIAKTSSDNAADLVSIDSKPILKIGKISNINKHLSIIGLKVESDKEELVFKYKNEQERDKMAQELEKCFNDDPNPGLCNVDIDRFAKFFDKFGLKINKENAKFQITKQEKLNFFDEEVDGKSYLEFLEEKNGTLEATEKVAKNFSDNENQVAETTHEKNDKTVIELAKETAHDVKETVSDFAENLKEKLEKNVDHAKEAVSDAATAVKGAAVQVKNSVSKNDSVDLDLADFKGFLDNAGIKYVVMPNHDNIVHINLTEVKDMFSGGSVNTSTLKDFLARKGIEMKEVNSKEIKLSDVQMQKLDDFFKFASIESYSTPEASKSPLTNALAKSIESYDEKSLSSEVENQKDLPETKGLVVEKTAEFMRIASEKAKEVSEKLGNQADSLEGKDKAEHSDDVASITVPHSEVSDEHQVLHAGENSDILS